MDLKLKDHLNNIRDFKLLLPETRNADNEIFISTILNELGFLVPEIKYMNVQIHKFQKKYLFYENLSKQTLERNKKIEGPIIRGDERFFFNKKNQFVFARLENSKWIKKNSKNELEESIKALSFFNYHFTNTFMLKKNINQFNDDFFIFDKEKLNKFQNKSYNKMLNYQLLINAFGATNALTINDIRFYYNPQLETFEPIYNDGSSNFLENPNRINFKYLNTSHALKVDSLISDIKKINLNKVVKKLNDKGLYVSLNNTKYSIQKLIKRLEYIKNNIKADLVSNNSVEKNKNIYQKDLYFVYYIRNNLFNFCINNTCSENKLSLDDIKKLLNQRLIINNKKVIFLGYKNYNNSSMFEGYFNKQLNLKTNTKIFFNNNTKIEINNKLKEILILSAKNSKLIFYGGGIDEYKIKVNYDSSAFKNTNNQYNKKIINGCLNFYETKFNKTSIEISNPDCEDGINISNSTGQINNILVQNSFSDALDIDFSDLSIKKINIKNAGNDCVDVSFGDYKIETVDLKNCKDKGISIGEKSNFNSTTTNIDKANIAIAVKDQSIANISYLNSTNEKKCLAMYRKKREFAGASLNIDKFQCNDKKNYIDPGNLLNLKNVF